MGGCDNRRGADQLDGRQGYQAHAGPGEERITVVHHPQQAGASSSKYGRRRAVAAPTIFQSKFPPQKGKPVDVAAVSELAGLKGDDIGFDMGYKNKISING